MSDEQPGEPTAPRDDAAAPAWYPHPRRAGALRYWNGVAWVEADATQGWYPDPADRRALRFWTGRTWGEVLREDPSRPAIVPEPEPESAPEPEPAPLPEPIREPQPPAAPEPAWDPERAASVDAVLGASAPPPIPAVAPNPRLAKAPDAPSSSWITAVVAVACLVAGTVIGGVVVSTFLGGDGDEPAATRTVTATASATGTAAPATGDPELVVRKVLSSRTLELKGEDGKVEVRLLGLGATTCDTNGPGKDLLKEQVLGQDAVISTLTDPVTGEVGAYVDVAGQDVGELLIDAGLATAAVGHPRAPQYARAQAGATPYCTASASPTATATP